MQPASCIHVSDILALPYYPMEVLRQPLSHKCCAAAASVTMMSPDMSEMLLMPSGVLQVSVSQGNGVDFTAGANKYFQFRWKLRAAPRHEMRLMRGEIVGGREDLGRFKSFQWLC